MDPWWTLQRSKVGGPAYKRLMREDDIIDKELLCDPKSTASPELIKRAPEQKMKTFQMPILVDGIVDHLPPWLGGPDQRTQNLSKMLRALKAAVELHLEDEKPI